MKPPNLPALALAYFAACEAVLLADAARQRSRLPLMQALRAGPVQLPDGRTLVLRRRKIAVEVAWVEVEGKPRYAAFTEP